MSEEIEQVRSQQALKEFSSVFWESIKSISDFMRLNTRKFYSLALSFTICAYFISIIFGVLIGLRLFADLAKDQGYEGSGISQLLYISMGFQVPQVTKYLGIVSASIFAIFIVKHLGHSSLKSFKLKSVFKTVDSDNWTRFSLIFMGIVFFNGVFYKEIFNVFNSDFGFIELEQFSPEWKEIIYVWLNGVFNFIKSLLPYIAGFFVYFFSRVTVSQRKKLPLRKILFSTMVVCFILDIVFVDIILELYNLACAPLYAMFKSEFIITIFKWAIMLPVTALFVILFSAAFIFPLENELVNEELSLNS